MIRNGDKDQFGDLMEHLQKQYALETDQFPKTLTNIADVMAAHEAKILQEKAKKKKTIKMKQTTKDKEIIKTPKITHPEEEMKRATDRTKNCSVTYAAKKPILRQSVNNETKWHTTIGM